MKYLLDTRALIYLGSGYEDKIGEKALKIYKSEKNEIYISQISFWEMSIKINIGKLHISIGLKNVMVLSSEAGIEMLPVSNAHILQYHTLDVKNNHKDPFDRYIIAVALYEDMIIISNDKNFDQYENVKRVWD